MFEKQRKKNGFKVTVTNFYYKVIEMSSIKTFYTLLSQDIPQDLFIFIPIELRENTKTWGIFAWFHPLAIAILSKAWTRAFIHSVKTSTAFNLTMDPQKKSSLSLSCLAYAGSTFRQYWLLDVSRLHGLQHTDSLVNTWPQMRQEINVFKGSHLPITLAEEHQKSIFIRLNKRTVTCGREN